MLPRRFKGSGSTIIVAIGPNDSSTKLIQHGVDLSRKTGMGLRLLSVCEPYIAEYWDFAPFGGSQVSAAIREAEAEEENQAQQKLIKLQKENTKDIGSSINVRSGSPAIEIIADAEEVGAALILIGARQNAKRFLPHGFSAALTLMAESPVPVMVIPDNCQVDLAKKPCKVLIADDLQIAGEIALQGGCMFAEAIENCNILHVHATALNPEDLQIVLQTALATSHTEMEKGLDGKDLFDMAREKISSKLQSRNQAFVDNLKSMHCTITQKVLNGPALGAIHNAILECDVAVFGRHHLFHRRPFNIGRMPFQAMLDQTKPIIIFG